MRPHAGVEKQHKKWGGWRWEGQKQRRKREKRNNCKGIIFGSINGSENFTLDVISQKAVALRCYDSTFPFSCIVVILPMSFL